MTGSSLSATGERGGPQQQFISHSALCCQAMMIHKFNVLDVTCIDHDLTDYIAKEVQQLLLVLEGLSPLHQVRFNIFNLAQVYWKLCFCTRYTQIGYICYGTMCQNSHSCPKPYFQTHIRLSSSHFCWENSQCEAIRASMFGNTGIFLP